MARTAAEKMSKTLGQQIVIENRGGAGGSIATRQIAKSVPDGYTLGMATIGQFCINQFLYARMPWDIDRDFVPVALTYELPRAEGDPYYPIPRPENAALYKRYEALADASDVVFVGRLATYRYYNMDQVVGQALSTYRKFRASMLSAAADRRPIAKVA